MRREAIKPLMVLWLGSAPLIAAAGSAFADEIDALSAKVNELDARMGTIDALLQPPKGPGPELAERRLIDGQVLYELKNYEMASIVLLDVVEKYPTSAAYPEAVYYLADALYLNRDYLSSRRYFEKVVDMGPQSRRYQEALERLVELSLHTGDYRPVDGYITKLEALTGEKVLPSVPYVKGKYFFFRQNYDRALDAFKPIAAGHPYYFHALYFIGAANVAKGGDSMGDAVQAFGTILKTKPQDDAQQRIVELAHMGLGRIYYDRGQLTSALEEYARIPNKSDLFNDALYETAWVNIKAKDYKKAARSLDLLLTNDPETTLGPEVKLLIGNLLVRQEEYRPATDQFARTRDEFSPLHQQLKAKLDAAGDAQKYFRDLIAKNLSKFDTAALVPQVAVKWIKAEPNTNRVVTVVGDVADLKKSLDDADDIVRRLDKALAGPSRVNVFPEMAVARTRGVEVASGLMKVKSELSEREAKLIAPVAGAEKGVLTRLENERRELEKRLAEQPANPDKIAERQKQARAALNSLDQRAVEVQTTLSGIIAATAATKKLYHDQVESTLPPSQRAAAQQELDAWTAELEKEQHQVDQLRQDLTDAGQSVGVDDADMRLAAQLKTQYNDVLTRQHEVGLEIRSRLGGSERSQADKIESVLERARAVEQRLAAYNARIDSIVDAKLKDIEAMLGEEKGHLGGFRGTLASCTTDTEEVGGGIVAENFRQVANRFYQVVVRSDVGIIDVAWALKDSKTQTTRRLLAQRQRELKLLDDEFKEVLKESP